MSWLSDEFQKLKAWAIQENVKLADVLGPVEKEIETLVTSHLATATANIGTVVIQGIQAKKPAAEIESDAKTAAISEFKATEQDAISAAETVGIQIAEAHFGIHPDYTTVNN